MPCIFRPYTSETDLIAAHLRENDLRDPLLFLDHAVAIMALKRHLESQTGAELPMAAYEKKLQEMGHRVSRRDLNRMAYTVQWLDEAVPVALRHGLGPRLVDQLAKLHKTYGMYWDDLGEALTGTTAFDPLFLNALNAHDGDILPLETIKDTLNQQITDVTGVPVQQVRAGVEILLGLAGRGDRCADRAGTPEPAHGGTPAAPEPPGSTGADAAERGGARVAPAPRPPFDPEPSATVAAPGRPGPEFAGLPAEPAPAEPAAGRAADSPEPARPAPPSLQPEAPPAAPVPATYLNPEFESGRDRLPRADDFKSLRSRAVVLAIQVAQAAGLQHLVRPDRETPAGFSLRALEGAASERETCLWWLLNALSAGRGFDGVPPSEHVCGYDPAAFAEQFLFRFDDGRPPPDSLLRHLFLLIEAIVALARAGISELTGDEKI